MNFRLKYLSLVCGKGRLFLRLSKPKKDILRRKLGNRMSLRSTRVVIRVNQDICISLFINRGLKEQASIISGSLQYLTKCICSNMVKKKNFTVASRGGGRGGRRKKCSCTCPRAFSFFALCEWCNWNLLCFIKQMAPSKQSV